MTAFDDALEPTEHAQDSEGTQDTESLGEIAASFGRSLAMQQRSEQDELLPMHLARACAAFLSIDGAGVSVLSDQFRVPIGASDEQSTAAERMQFTIGDGPCLAAIRERQVVVADERDMERRWPAYHRDLVERTSFRAVASLPYELDHNLYGALDLYLESVDQLRSVALPDALVAAQQVARTLAGARSITAPEAVWSEPSVPEPAWLHGVPPRARVLVWAAVGMLMIGLDLDATNSLAVLRAYSYSHETTIDEVADSLVHGSLDASDIDG